VSLDSVLTAETTTRVLDRLAIPVDLRSAGLTDLTALFLAWCRAVPFDNALRFLALREGSSQVLPGRRPESFFRAWLADGCGGMCVPTASALHALLLIKGYTAKLFAARLGQAETTDHLTTVVAMPSGGKYALDTVGLPEEPVPLRAARSCAGRGVHRVRADPIDGSWHLTWYAPVNRSSMVCRIGSPISASQIQALYRKTQASREISQFNTVLYARTNVESGIISVIGRNVFVTEDGQGARSRRCRAEDVLADTFGWSARLLDRLSQAGAFR
jgi:arylamine N-acetyltransferase